MLSCIREIVDEYRKSIVQSEEEVKSKLIVPLINALGYPSSFRAEEFPVYGFEGREKLNAKLADYLLFSDNRFAEHRTRTQKNLDWVYAHSLLVVEAKKPNEMPDILGQPMFYAVWTRAVAYMIIDGEHVQGYFYNATNQDYQVVECSVDDLHKCEEIKCFSYQNVLSIKNSGWNKKLEPLVDDSEYRELKALLKKDGIRLVDSSSISTVTEEELKDFPEETMHYMRESLGRNAEGLSDLQVMSRFLHTTDAYLQNDLRYDIPAYMLDIPRHLYKARLYVENKVFPIETGEVIEYYRDIYSNYEYKSNKMRINFAYQESTLIEFEIGFEVQDNTVQERLNSFKTVREIITASSIRIVLDNEQRSMFSINDNQWENRQILLSMYDFWVKGLMQMQIIEEFYDIKFRLKPVLGAENINRLYDAVGFVYDGIMMNENCEIYLPGGIIDKNINIVMPWLLEERDVIPLPVRTIHGISFIPYRSWILPGEINMKDTETGDIVTVSGCCEYKISGENDNE